MPSLIDVNSTLGAMLVGTLLAGCLWGVSTSQTWHYYNTFPHDNKYTKGLVAVLWALETSHQGLISHALYTFVISNFANPLALLTLDQWTIIIQTPVEAVTTLLVQIFFIYRIYRLSQGNYFVSAILFLLAMGQFVIVCVFTARFLQRPNFLLIQDQLLPTLMPAMAGLSVVTDISVAIAMCYLLNRNRSEGGRTGKLLDTLMYYALSTGILTSIFAIAHLIMYVYAPQSFWYMASFFVASRLYFNSLLASLNLRHSTKPDPAESFFDDVSRPQPFVNHGTGGTIPIIAIGPNSSSYVDKASPLVPNRYTERF